MPFAALSPSLVVVDKSSNPRQFWFSGYASIELMALKPQIAENDNPTPS
ncbi:hypothetical protein [Methyloglobulus sp.]